jgi:hypothetical protein
VLIRSCGDLRLVVREVALDLPSDAGTIAGRADVEGVRAVDGIQLAMLAFAMTHSTVLEHERVVSILVGEGCR